PTIDNFSCGSVKRQANGKEGGSLPEVLPALAERPFQSLLIGQRLDLAHPEQLSFSALDDDPFLDAVPALAHVLGQPAAELTLEDDARDAQVAEIAHEVEGRDEDGAE